MTKNDKLVTKSHKKGQTSVKKATNLSIKVKKVTKSDKLVKKKDTNL